MSYAFGTSVTVSKSRAELVSMLEDRGVTDYMVANENGQTSLVFRWEGLAFRLTLPVSDPAKFVRTAGGKTRTNTEALKAANAEDMRRWRVLVMVVKAKLVAIEEGITTMESEFMADIITGPAATLRDTLQPAINAARLGGAGILSLPQGGR